MYLFWIKDSGDNYALFESPTHEMETIRPSRQLPAIERGYEDQISHVENMGNVKLACDPAHQEFEEVEATVYYDSKYRFGVPQADNLRPTWPLKKHKGVMPTQKTVDMAEAYHTRRMGEIRLEEERQRQEREAQRIIIEEEERILREARLQNDQKIFDAFFDDESEDGICAVVNYYDLQNQYRNLGAVASDDYHFVTIGRSVRMIFRLSKIVKGGHNTIRVPETYAGLVFGKKHAVRLQMGEELGCTLVIHTV